MPIIRKNDVVTELLFGTVFWDYSKFMHGLKLAEVDINRKMLAELAVSDKEGFAALADIAKEKIA